MECTEHVDCTGKAEEEGGQCDKCAGLEDWQPLSRMPSITATPKPQTPMQFRGMQAMCNSLEDQRASHGKEFLRVRNLQRQMAPLRERVSPYEWLVNAVACRDAQRIATIIAAARRRGFGLKCMVGLLEDAARANGMRYTEKECAMAVMLNRVGGPSAVHILHVANLLPSVRHTQRLAARITHRVTHELCVQIADQAWEDLEWAPVTVHFDEISIVQRLVLGPNVEGLCEHAPRVYFKTMSDLVPIITHVQNGTWHVAKHARVVAVSWHSNRNYAAVPIACIASCIRFTSEEASSNGEDAQSLGCRARDGWSYHELRNGWRCKAAEGDE